MSEASSGNPRMFLISFIQSVFMTPTWAKPCAGRWGYKVAGGTSLASRGMLSSGETQENAPFPEGP